MKRLSIALIFLLFLPALAYGNLAFRGYKPSTLIPPQSRLLSLHFNVESRFIKQKVLTLQSPPWIDMNLVGSYELSPFPIKNINVGLQGTLGSYGLMTYATGKWIPFPDYRKQPAFGILADVYSGFASDKKFVSGSHLQILVSKSFPIRRQPHLDNWGVYFIPTVHVDLMKLSQFSYLIHWIAGVNLNFNENRVLSRQWALNLEGDYNSKFYQISLNFSLYIQ